jgi:DNA-binding NarL/FixJ family response regulator
MLEGHRDWSVCGEASNGHDAVRLAAELKPDIAVVDLELPELDGLEVTRRIRKEQPEVEVLIFTIHDTEYLIRDVLCAGAKAYILKSEGGSELLEAIESVAQHQPFFTAKASQVLLQNLFESPPSNDSGALTAREREVVQLLVEGKSNKQVGATLQISVKTVEAHRTAIMRKLGFTSVVDLVRYAVRNHIISA